MGITSEEMKETILNKEIQSKSIEVKSNNCITGYDDYLYIRLKNSIEKATSIDIIVAFLMESGVRLLENNLKKF